MGEMFDCFQVREHHTNQLPFHRITLLNRICQDKGSKSECSLQAELEDLKSMTWQELTANDRRARQGRSPIKSDITQGKYLSSN